MKIKIDVADLKPGMYVAELDRPWLESPFLFQGFFLDSPTEVQEVQSVCKYVYIDTEKVDDTPLVNRPNPFLTQKDIEPVSKMLPTASARKKDAGEKDSFENEFARAWKIHNRARELVYSMHFDVRMGKLVDTNATRKVVGELVDSIVRNPDTQIWLAQLREKDDYTAEHSLSACIFCLAFGRHMGLDEAALTELGLGAILHDIGKLRIPAEILNKPAELTVNERQLINLHPEYGRDILLETGGLSEAVLEMVYCHHETVDGKGYPRGLSKDDIPLYARMLAVVDSYDAMTTKRVFRSQISSYEALKVMYGWRGDRYDTEMVEQFIQCLGIYPVGCLVELQSGEVGIVMSNNNKAHRLRPKVLLVLNREKRRLKKPRVVDLKAFEGQQGSEEYKVKTVLDPNAFALNIRDYVKPDEWFAG